MSILQGFLKLRVSLKSDSRTVNLVNLWANLLNTCGDQGSISASAFVLSQLSTRHDQQLMFGARPRPMGNPKVGLPSHLTLLTRIVRFLFRLRDMVECKVVHVMYKESSSKKFNKARDDSSTPSEGIGLINGP